MFHAIRTGRVAAAICVLLPIAQPASAATYAFMGTRENVTRPPTPNTGRCAPAFPRTIVIEPGALSSTGTSNFGAFTASMSHCEATAAPEREVIDGRFSFDFGGGDSLFGSYSGQLAPGAPEGGLNVLHNFIVAGGSGRFLNATGAFTSIGILRGGLVDGAPAGIFAGGLDGRIVAAGVPEPSAWISMIAGFGLLGGALRTRHAKRVLA